MITLCTITCCNCNGKLQLTSQPHDPSVYNQRYAICPHCEICLAVFEEYGTSRLMQEEEKIAGPELMKKLLQYGPGYGKAKLELKKLFPPEIVLWN